MKFSPGRMHRAAITMMNPELLRTVKRILLVLDQKSYEDGQMYAVYLFNEVLALKRLIRS
jgi:hypothetical protein